MIGYCCKIGIRSSKNWIAEKFVEQKPVPEVNLRNVEEIIIPPKKTQKI